MFRVGQKVVCVDNSGGIEPRPETNRVYTVGSVRMRSDLKWGFPIDSLGITLVELPTTESDGYYAEFYAWRFRPVVDTETKVSDDAMERA